MALSEQQQPQQQPHPPPAPPSSRKRLRMETTSSSSPSLLHIPLSSSSSSFLDDLDSSFPLPSSPAHRRRLSEIMDSLQLAIQSALSPPLPPTALHDRDDDLIYEILSAGQQGPAGAAAVQASEVQHEATLLETLIPSADAEELVPASDGSGSSEEEEEDAEDLQRFLAQLSADSSSEFFAGKSELWGDDLFGF